MLPALRIVRCHEPTGKAQHAACRQALAQQQRAPLLIIHTYRHWRRGAEIILDLRPGGQLLGPALRRALDDHFAVWELAGWIGPGGVGLTSPWWCRWSGVPLAVLPSFIGDLLRLVGAPPIALKEPRRELRP